MKIKQIKSGLLLATIRNILLVLSLSVKKTAI